MGNRWRQIACRLDLISEEGEGWTLGKAFSCAVPQLKLFGKSRARSVPTRISKITYPLLVSPSALSSALIQSSASSAGSQQELCIPCDWLLSFNSITPVNLWAQIPQAQTPERLNADQAPEVPLCPWSCPPALNTPFLSTHPSISHAQLQDVALSCLPLAWGKTKVPPQWRRLYVM